MVTTESDTGQTTYRFIIRPNRSLTSREALLFFASLCVVLLGIAIGFLLQGLWGVLPFAGLELLVLGVALYLCWRSSGYFQVITIDQDSVLIDHQMGGRAANRQTFLRGWVRVYLEPPRYRWYPSRLLLGSHGRLVEIGPFLVEDERVRLAGLLRQAIQYRVR